MHMLLLALWLIASSQAATLAECTSPALEPAALLPEPAQLRPQVVPLPEVPPLPSVGTVELSSRDAAALAGLGVFLGLVVILARRRRLVAAGLALSCAGTLALAEAARREVRDVNATLSAALAAGEAGEHAEALALLDRVRAAQQGALLSPLGSKLWQPAVVDADIDALVQANGVAAVRTALEADDLDAALAALDLFAPGDSAADQAGLAALTRKTRSLHDLGVRAQALELAERARDWSPDHTAVRTNLCRTRALRAAQLGLAGRHTDALALAEQIDPGGCEVTESQLAVLRGLAARDQARAHLAVPEDAQPDLAVAVLERAAEYTQQHGGELAFVSCDLAGALEAHAVRTLVGGQPTQAVAALDRSDALVPQREAIRVLLPNALIALAAELLAAAEYDQAIAALERAHIVAGPDSDVTRQALLQGWVAKGAALHQAGQLDDAIAAFRTGQAVDPQHRLARVALADALLERSDTRLVAGARDSAREDLVEAAAASPERRVTARAMQDEVDRLDRDLGAMARTPRWLHAPQLHAGVPRDVDLDGQVDLVAYYERGGTEPRAFRLRRSGWIDGGSLVLTAAGIGTEVVAVLRDLDRDGIFDERQEFADGRLDGLITDVDGDGLPDVRSRSTGGGRMTEQALSGRLEIVVEDGVVNANTDFASDPDAYVKLFHNGAGVTRTRTASNSYHPSWGQGVVIDYRHKDRVRLELWDEDWFVDDLVDSWETTELPTSGVVVMDQRRAALTLTVRPSTLPSGHQVVRRADAGSTNVFRDAPWQVPEAADVIAGARLARARTKVEQLVTEVVITELLLPRLLPHATPVQLFFAGMLVEAAVLDSITGG